MFMYNLLQNMEFHLATGFGLSKQSLSQVGQGMLQGSSSAATIYNVNSDVSLTTYKRLATGSNFIHPITGENIMDHATQYVDDKTELLNVLGANIPSHTPSNLQ